VADLTGRVALVTGAAQQAFGRIDILVNNAGVNRDTLVVRMSEKEWAVDGGLGM
jgi:3-oxoacyl-[acyl-carrier protein] reductase